MQRSNLISHNILMKDFAKTEEDKVFTITAEVSVLLTPKVVRSSSCDLKGCVGSHSRSLISVYGQHSKIFFGHETNIVPFSIIQSWTCNDKNRFSIRLRFWALTGPVDAGSRFWTSLVSLWISALYLAPSIFPSSALSSFTVPADVWLK